MNIVEYTEFLVKSIASLEEMVSVKEIGSDDENIHLEVLVKESDMGAVIGRQGNTLKAIRTLVQTYSFRKEKKKVKLNVESF